VPIPHRTVTKNDVIRLIRRMIQINNGVEPPDDIDHLGNRRVKTVGELIQNKLRIGLRRMERVIKERMSIRDQEQLSPVTLVNIRPVVAALREFFFPSSWIRPTRSLSCVISARYPRWVLAVCAVNALASMYAMSITHTMDASARSKHRKVQTSV
jgi:DNA-directed RNA polymerase beta subunit